MGFLRIFLSTLFSDVGMHSHFHVVEFSDISRVFTLSYVLKFTAWYLKGSVLCVFTA